MSLRNFLDILNDDGGYKAAPPSLSIRHEIPAWIRESCERNGPALLFPIPIDPGKSENEMTKIFETSVVGGVYANPDNIKRIISPGYGYGNNYIDRPNVDAVERYHQCAQVRSTDKLSDYSRLSKRDVPVCQECVYEGSDINLYELPICHHNEKDSGRFITAGVQVVPWVDNVTFGLGIHRMKIVDRYHLSCLAPPNRRVGFPHYEASKRDEGVKMAVLIGAAPEIVLASQAKINQDCQKYIVASNLQNKALNMTKCITSDILVPTDTEMVLECTTLPNSEYDDTPFGEYPGTYSYRSNSFIVRVDAITTRHDYMYQTILTGKVPQEDSNLCAIPYAEDIYMLAKKVVERITDISVFLGNNVFDTIICIDKKSNSQVTNMIHLLLGNKYLKSVCVMDKDMQATEECWRFAFNTRYQPNRDTTITNLALGASLDPSSPLFQSTSKIGMDLTIPIGKTEEETKLNQFRHSVANTRDFNVDFNSLGKIL